MGLNLSNCSRRDFMKFVGIGTASATLAGCMDAIGGVSGKTKANRPNVLFIAIDDLNDWVGCLNGYPGKVHTPNIDRLAGKGVLFTNAHICASICNPSRAALWSGKRPSTSGIYNNEQHLFECAPKTVTLAKLFHKNGYKVLGGGKVYHHAKWHWMDDGFDEYKPFRYAPWPKDNKKVSYMRWGKLDGPMEQMPDYQLASFAIDHLNQKHDKPFLLIPGIFRPHTPLWTPRKYYDMYPLEDIVLPETIENDLDDIPPRGKSFANPKWYDPFVKGGYTKEVIQAYLAAISFVDDQVGRIIDALEKSAYADNTIVVLWSDHGFHLTEKRHFFKMTLWEESTRIPFIMRVPGLTKPGAKCSRPIDTIDIYPTLADLCQIKLKKGAVDGVSIRPLLENPEAKWEKPALTFLTNNVSVRGQRWRYIRYDDGTEELYDHDTDPHEWTNLASKPGHEKIKQRLAKWIPKKFAEPAPFREGFIPPAEADLTEKQRELLEVRGIWKKR